MHNAVYVCAMIYVAGYNLTKPLFLTHCKGYGELQGVILAPQDLLFSAQVKIEQHPGDNHQQAQHLAHGK